MKLTLVLTVIILASGLAILTHTPVACAQETSTDTVKTPPPPPK